MKGNVDKILKMVEEKKITAEEAVKLLDSLNQPKSNGDCSEEKGQEKCPKDSVKEGFKKFEEGIGKLEIEIDETVKKALLKISEVTKDLAEKMDKQDDVDVNDEEDDDEDLEDVYEDLFEDLEK